MNATELKNAYELGSRSISYKDYFAGQKTVEYLPLGVYDSEQNSLVIDDYPYGFLRTQIRYWIETTNRGDRFVSQTLNPKTNKWNAPKKSTYQDVMVLIANGAGYVNSFSLRMNDDVTKADAFLTAFGEQLNKAQIRKIHAVKGWAKAMEHVTFSVKPRQFRHKVTGEIVTAVNIMEMNQYEPVDDDGSVVDEEAEKEKKEETFRSIGRVATTYAAKSFLEAKNGSQSD